MHLDIDVFYPLNPNPKSKCPPIDTTPLIGTTSRSHISQSLCNPNDTRSLSYDPHPATWKCIVKNTLCSDFDFYG